MAVPTLVVNVLGLSRLDGENFSNHQGIGKSCLCYRFVYPGYDDYVEDHRSLLASHEFESDVIHKDHFLYWGSTTRTYDAKGSSEKVHFEVLEYTAFYEDITDQPFRNNSKRPVTSFESYMKMAVGSPLESPGKISYKNRDLICYPQDYESVVFPPGIGMHPRGYVVVVDVSDSGPGFESRLRLTENTVAHLVKKKQNFVVAAAKRDEAFTTSLEKLGELARAMKFTLIEVSAKSNVNVSEAFEIVAAKVLSKAAHGIPTQVLSYQDAAKKTLSNRDRARRAFRSFLQKRVTLGSERLKALECTEEYKACAQLHGKFETDKMFAQHVLTVRNDEVSCYAGVTDNVEMRQEFLEDYVVERTDLSLYANYLKDLIIKICQKCNNEMSTPPTLFPPTPPPLTSPEMVPSLPFIPIPPDAKHNVGSGIKGDHYLRNGGDTQNKFSDNPTKVSNDKDTVTKEEQDYEDNDPECNKPSYDKKPSQRKKGPPPHLKTKPAPQKRTVLLALPSTNGSSDPGTMAKPGDGITTAKTIAEDDSKEITTVTTPTTENNLVGSQVEKPLLAKIKEKVEKEKEKAKNKPPSSPPVSSPKPDRFQTSEPTVTPSTYPMPASRDPPLRAPATPPQPRNKVMVSAPIPCLTTVQLSQVNRRGSPSTDPSNTDPGEERRDSSPSPPPPPLLDRLEDDLCQDGSEWKSQAGENSPAPSRIKRAYESVVKKFTWKSSNSEESQQPVEPIQESNPVEPSQKTTFLDMKKRPLPPEPSPDDDHEYEPVLDGGLGAVGWVGKPPHTADVRRAKSLNAASQKRCDSHNGYKGDRPCLPKPGAPRCPSPANDEDYDYPRILGMRKQAPPRRVKLDSASNSMSPSPRHSPGTLAGGIQASNSVDSYMNADSQGEDFASLDDSYANWVPEESQMSQAKPHSHSSEDLSVYMNLPLPDPAPTRPPTSSPTHLTNPGPPVNPRPRRLQTNTIPRTTLDPLSSSVPARGLGTQVQRVPGVVTKALPPRNLMRRPPGGQ